MVSVIKQFAESARRKDVAPIADLMADDVRLHGTVWKPFEGKDAVLAVFAMLLTVTQDADYVAEYEGPAGIVLQLRGKVGGRDFDSVQILTFNEDDLINECRDLLRPHSAGTALLEAAGEYLGRQGSGN